ncbi:MAG: ThiF family adenylyltransferase [Planctomycetota bacterium]|jgi:adenylyltransferase/sulfurtransferase
MPREEKRYARQEILEVIGPGGQEKLADAMVIIIGVGALGSVQAELLTRAGVGRILVVDRDVPEEINLHRQILFDEEDVRSGLPKAEAAARKLTRLNSLIRVEARSVDVTPRNIEALVRGADLVLDGTDNLETRYLINDAAVKAEIPWVYGGVIGTEGMIMAVHPGKGPCLRCLFPTPSGPGILPTCETEGVLNAAAATVGSLQAAEAFRILVGEGPRDPVLLSLDVWKGTFRSVSVCRDSECPCCGSAKFDFLDADSASWASRLCGRNAVQITPSGDRSVPLEALASRLEKAGKVSFNGFLLHLEVEGHTLMVFPDGRCIVKGTEDLSRARSLVAKYVGC